MSKRVAIAVLSLLILSLISSPPVLPQAMAGAPAHASALQVNMSLPVAAGLSAQDWVYIQQQIARDQLSAAAGEVSALDSSEDKKLTGSGAAAYANFGWCASISDDTIVIGTQLGDDSGTRSGSAYVFVRDQGGPDNWGQLTKLTASDGAAWDAFGVSVAISGDIIVVGAAMDDDNGPNSGSAYVFARDQGGLDNWGEVTKLTASDGAEDNWFGETVAVSGDTIVVGAPSDDDNGSNSGSAYVFGRDQGGPDNWGQITKLTASDGADDTWFGDAVAVSADTIIIGAPEDDDNGPYSGSAYVFGRDQGGVDNWGQLTKLVASDAAEDNWFGVSVAISGDTIVVGAPGDDDNGLFSGSAYVFGRDQGGADNWGQLTKLIASDGATEDSFGGSVAIWGDSIVIGAPGEDDSGSDSGSAYVFARDQGGADNWGQLTKLTASDGVADDAFGVSVAISGDSIVVGASGGDDSGSESGSAYAFARDQGGVDNWGQLTKLIASDAAEDNEFGLSVAISGDTIVVGARGDDDSGLFSGSAYVFVRDQGGLDNWGQLTKLTASDGALGDFFGSSVAISGDTIVVGAPGDDDNGSDSGSAYVFARDQGGVDNWGQLTKLIASDAAEDNWFGDAVAVSADTIIIGAPEDDDNGPYSGSAYVFARDQGGLDNWGQLTKLIASDAAEDNWFGQAVAISGDTIVVGALGDDDNGLFSGSAYVFGRDQGGVDNWGQLTKLTASDGAPEDLFGESVAISVDTILIGSPYDDDNGSESGSAYVFARDQGGPDNWGQLTKLIASDGAADVLFGLSVAISGDTIIIGAPGYGDNGLFSGSAYAFGRDQGGVDNWGQLTKLTASDGAPDDLFGESIAIRGDTILIGAPYDDDNGSESGSAYVWLQGILPRPTLLSPEDGSVLPVGDVTFTWTSLSGVSSYQIQIDVAETFDSPSLISATVSTESYAAAMSTGVWYWQVRALPDGAWTGAWGLRVADPVVQVTTDLGDDFVPSIMQADDGKLWVVWDSSRSGNSDLWYKTSSDGGATWSTGTQLTTDTDSDNSPAIAQGTDGKLWVAWQSNRPGDSNLWYKTSSDGGATWSTDTQLPLTTDRDYDYAPAIAQATDGTLWVVWFSASFGYPDIWYKTSSDGGATWSTDTQLTTDANRDSSPAIAHAADGKLWVVWVSDRSGNPDIWYKTSSDGGATWSTDTQLTTDSAYDYSPSIAQTPDSKLWVMWNSSRLGNDDIWYKTSSDNGVTWSTERQWTSFIGDDFGADLAPLSGGSVAVAWDSDRAINYDIWFGVFGQREDVSPPPQVASVQHLPGPNPLDTDTVTVRAYVVDESAVESATLVWSRDGLAQSDLAMYDDGTHGDDTAGDGWYAVQIGPFPAGTQVQYQVRAEDTDGSTVTSPQDPSSFTVLERFEKTAEVLLVADDGPYETEWFQGYYTDALDDAGRAHDLWDVYLRGVPDTAVLDQYLDGAVVWASPYFEACLCIWWDHCNPDETTTALSSYLDAGGRLFISGQDIGAALQSESFYNNYLHAQYVQDDTDLYMVNGTAGDPIGDGLVLSISGGDGANNQYYPSEVDPIAPAVSVFTYDAMATAPETELAVPKGSWIPSRVNGGDLIGVPWRECETCEEPLSEEGWESIPPEAGVAGISSSGTAALRVDTGTYKVVYFAFGFEAINSSADRAVVMARVLTWLGVPAPPAQEIPLVPGWNLMSMYVEPTVPQVDYALGSIDGSYDRLLGEYGIYIPTLPITYNTLSELHSGLGYYIRITEGGGADLLLQGMRTPITTPLELHEGWNWIGYLPDTTLPVTVALQSIEGSYLRVLSQDKTYDPSIPEFSTLQEMTPGEGYLIRMTEPVTLTYPAAGGSGLGLERATALEACVDVPATPYFTLVYSEVTINGQPAPPGTRVDVLTPRGDVAGCFEVQRAGHYGFMHVYGEDDTATPVIPGFRDGETLRFQVNGVEAAVSAEVVWQDDKQPHLVNVSVNLNRLFLPMILAQAK